MAWWWTASSGEGASGTGRAAERSATAAAAGFESVRAQGSGTDATTSRNNIPADLRNEREESEVRGKSAAALDTTRMTSSIPMADFHPKHQRQEGKDEARDGSVGGSDGERRWVYPSPQQFYNALRRKGFDPDERDMDTYVTPYLLHIIIDIFPLSDASLCGGWSGVGRIRPRSQAYLILTR